jgi:dTDP-4-dehydrorhamnose reductase
MRILLIGNTGQLGCELESSFASLGEVFGFDFPVVDLAKASSIRNIVREIKPELILNAAAYTNVDKAEIEPELAFLINGTAPGILAEEARLINSALIHYSTDYVFDGEKGSAYTESDLPNPINIYGKSKLAGEQAVQAVGGSNIILRTAWVYNTYRDNFVTKVLQWARHNETIRVVNDQISNPTWARLLAMTTSLMIAKGGADIHTWLSAHQGIYHLAGNGYASRFDWAEEILTLDLKKEEQIVKEIKTARTSEFSTPAQRPLFSALNCGLFYETFKLTLPGWKKGLTLAMRNK